MTQLARRPKVEKIIDHKRTWIADTLNPESNRYDPSFPKPFKMGNSQTNVWVLDEIHQWVEAQIEKGRADTKPVHANGQIARA